MNDLIVCSYLIYDCLAPAKSGAGRGNPSSGRRTSAPYSCRRFLLPACYVMAAVRGTLSSVLVSFQASFHPAYSRHQSRGKDVGDSFKLKGVIMTKLRLSLAHIRAKAHRRMAIAALHADSSLSVRLSRYRHHVEIARSLEAKDGVK